MAAESPDARHLLNLNGSCFDDLESIAIQLEKLSNADRIDYRNRNATAIARCEVHRLLIVAGPGAGKSHLFISRIEYWLELHSDKQIYVSTFVRKLILDLDGDIRNRLSADDQRRVRATTLHTLARSLLERSGGSPDLQLGKHIRIIDGYWASIVWEDVLAFHPGLPRSTYSPRRFDAQFHADVFDESDQWPAVRETYFELCKFFNAVGFAPLITLARDAVEANPGLNEHELWIVDEYQDLNTAEDSLIRALTDGATGTLFAGDDEQALYQTLKGSSPEIIIGHYNDEAFGKAMLPFCSRCSYYVCRAASAFMSNHRAVGAIAKIYMPLKVDEGATRVQIVATAAPSSSVDYIRKFLEDHAEEFAEYVERRNAGQESDPFLLILSQSGGLTLRRRIPAEQELSDLVAEWDEGSQTSRSADYRRVVTYATAGWYEHDNFAVRKLLHYEDVDTTAVHQLIVKAIEDGRALGDVASEDQPEAMSRARQVSASLDADTAGIEEKVAAMLDDILGLTDPAAFAHELAKHPIGQASAREAEDNEATETVGALPPVVAMSITGSKGLSAYHVIILGCDNVNLEKTSALAFFVGLTRARESLHLLVSAKAGGGMAPHEFLGELPSECCEYSVYKKTGRVFEGLSSFVQLQNRFTSWGSYR